MFATLISLSLILLSVRAQEFKCPTDHITKNNGVTGILPAGATSMVKIPKDTDCNYLFDVPRGFALKVEISTVFNPSPGDGVMFDGFYTNSNAVQEIEYAVDEVVTLELISKTGNLTFFTKYEYVDLTQYKQVMKPTGTYFNTTLLPNSYFTVQAPANDQVNLNYGSRDTGFVDLTLYEVFVFDGNDFTNSEYLGRFSNLFRHAHYDLVSTSNTITLLNLYGSPSDSFFLGNDESVIENMSQYGVVVIDSDKELNGTMANFNQEPDSWLTFICDGCANFYIENLQFDEKYENASGFVEVQGMSPTQRLPYILDYPYSQHTNLSLPQLITSQMATFHVHNASVDYTMQPKTKPDDFSTSPGKSGSVYSPQLLNPDAAPQFDYTFSGPLKVFNFSINLETIGLESDGDELDVQVGSVDGLTTLDKKYTKAKMTNTFISGKGRYLHLKYSGSKSSEVILSFKMIDPLEPEPPVTYTTSQSLDTSTLGSTVVSRSSRISTSTKSPTSTSTTAPSTYRSSLSSTQSTQTSKLVPSSTTIGKSFSPSSTPTASRISTATTNTPRLSTLLKIVTTESPSTSKQFSTTSQSSTSTTIRTHKYISSTSSDISTISHNNLDGSTVTLPKHVETTTKGATSLLSTGLLIFVILGITF